MSPTVVSTSQDPAEIDCSVLVVGAYKDKSGSRLSDTGRAIDEKLDGALTDFISDANHKGRVGDLAVVSTLGRLPARAVAVCGLGPHDEAGPSQVRKASGIAARKLSERKEIVTALADETGEEGAMATAEGFLLGGYAFTEFKTDPKKGRTDKITVVGGSEASIQRAITHAEATNLARDLINTPPSELTPEMFASRCEAMARSSGLECEVLDEKALADEGFGGLLGVARGGQNPPRFIKLRYSPEDARGKVALVGKGVTFDSGGLSLKDAKNMEQMKTDMAGAAAVAGAMSVLPRLDVGVEVSAYIPATENLPGVDAMKPGDVLKHYGGKTSEVLNTDAEGRLILADALAYATKDRPDAIVDLATLTGAMMVALGSKISGVFCNDDDLQEQLLGAAREAGEKLWPMPLDDGFKSMLSSEVADIKNTSGSRYGGAIFAAKFLEEFVGDDISWAHLDIAGPARAESSYNEVPKGGTGVGVRTLLRWLEKR